MPYGNFSVSRTCLFRNVNVFRNMFLNFSGFRNVFQNFSDFRNFSGLRNVFWKYSGFRNVFLNFSGFRNVLRNFSGFWNAFRNNFQFLKWNNFGICSGNGNRNSGIWIHISGSFSFHYGNFDLEYWNPYI